MSVKNILITGNGGHAVSCREVIDSIEDLNFSGYVTKDNSEIEIDIIGSDQDLETLFKKTDLIESCQLHNDSG